METNVQAVVTDSSEQPEKINWLPQEGSANEEEDIEGADHNNALISSGGGGGGVRQDNTRIGHHPDGVQLIDHFSLGNPSSSVRFRNKRVVLYAIDNDDEIVLEESPDEGSKNKITVKRYRTSSTGMRFLRTIYTLVCLLIVGFLVAFCFQIIAFLFLNMAADGGDTWSQEKIDIAHLCAVIASAPLQLYAMASILAMGTTVVEDTWKGNPLFQQLLGFSNDILMESICVVIFLVIPGLTAAITLITSQDDWWETTAMVWVISVLTFMALFALLVVLNEVGACLELTRMGYPTVTTTITFLLILAVLNTQTMFYSGYRRVQYLQKEGGGGRSCSSGGDHAATGDDARTTKQVLKSQTSLYSRMTLWKVCTKSCFIPLDPPERVYTADEVRDVIPIYTARNWSLERMFCRNPNKAAVFVQRGPGALRKNQVAASLAFSILGAAFFTFLVAGFLVWWDVPLLFVVFFSLLLLVCGILPVILTTIRLYRMYHQQPNQEQQPGPGGGTTALPNNFDKDDGGNKNKHGDSKARNDNDDPENEAIFQVWERIRISEPKAWFCGTVFGLAGAIGFGWPLMSFLAKGEYTTATFFAILGVFSIPRLYLNPVPILRKMGPLTDLPLSTTVTTMSQAEEGPNTPSGRSLLLTSRSGIANLLYGGQETEEESILRRKAKLSALVGKINNRSMVSGWMYFFGILMLFVGIFCFAAFQEQLDGFDYQVKVEEDQPFFAHDFYYPPHPTLPYPTCKIAKGFSLLDTVEDSNLVDIAYLAVMAFSAPEESKRLLREWFGEDDVVVDESQFVLDYRVEAGKLRGVSFKLFSFPKNPGVGLVSIRGSESLLDWVVDVQLWLGAALAQMIRAVIPLGWIWTPILDDLVYLVNSVESDNLKKVSYYTTTTGFVNDVLSGAYGDGNYTSLRVTGASLGGGLAIITGAQTNTTTVAISGLNAMLSRRTFDPPLSEEALNTHVFNVIPDRDPVAHVDDPGRLIQRTACRAPKNSYFGCHSMWRSICELSYQCGTMGRPALCWCVSRYGYPEPIPNGTMRTFAEVCPPDDDSES